MLSSDILGLEMEDVGVHYIGPNQLFFANTVLSSITCTVLIVLALALLVWTDKLIQPLTFTPCCYLRYLYYPLINNTVLYYFCLGLSFLQRVDTAPAPTVR